MCLHYGELFISKYGHFDSGIWQYVLTEINFDDLAHGVHRLFRTENDFAKFPPSPLEFRELCFGLDWKRKFKSNPDDNLPKVPLWPGLEDQSKKKPLDVEKAEEWIEKCFKIVGKPKRKKYAE